MSKNNSLTVISIIVTVVSTMVTLYTLVR